METALITGHIKEWQLTDLDKGVIVDAAFPNGPVTGTNGTVLVDLMASLLQIVLELCRRFRRENLVQTITNRIQLVKPQRVAFLKGCCLEIHKNLIFRDRSSHQLSVTAEDIASVGLHADTVTLQAVGNLRPILLLGSHDIEGLAYDSKPDDCQQYGNHHVSGHDLIVIKLTHLFLFWHFYDVGRLVSLMQQRVLVLFQYI